MTKDIEVNWAGILEKFSSYEGSIVCFCKENGIKPHQLYYHRKKVASGNISQAPLFHGIKINEEDLATKDSLTNKPNSKADTQIKIEIGKAVIYIPSHDKYALENILQIVMSTC